MKYPEFLQKNDRLGFIAPSFGCASLEPYHTRFQEAVKYFENLGYITKIGSNVYREDGIGKSTTAENCGAEINEFLLTDNCDAVLSVGGGETMCEDLEFVNFEGIANAKPKWFMGYSDNTNLIYTLATICDIASIYGPNASSFGMKPLHPYLTDTVALLEGKSLTAHQYDSWEIESLASPENPTATLNCTEAFQMSVYNQGVLREPSAPSVLHYVDTLKREDPHNNSSIGNTPCHNTSNENVLCKSTANWNMPLADNASLTSPTITVRGRMLGGCLDILCVLCGTRFDHTKEFLEKYDADGTIFFLESCDLNPLAILRGLWQLKNAGWFHNTKAFLFGRPLHIKESIMGLDCRQAALHVLGDMGVPIFFDLDIGHLPPQMPIICGAIGTVHAVGNSISITYSLK